MNPTDEKIRGAIAEQAGEWFVAHAERPLDARDSAALAAWFEVSPVHIEEFLGVSVVVRDLRLARSDPQYSLEAILARARSEDEGPVHRLWPRVTEAIHGRRFGGWLPATVTVAASALLCVGMLLKWAPLLIGHSRAIDTTAALQVVTRHGEQLTRRLADDSILHLNTDSAVTIRYSKSERLVTLNAGQATFEVAHELNRVFRVHAGSAEVVDLGTSFDVRLDEASTVVTVIEGRVAVGRTNSGQSRALQAIVLSADQQVRVGDGTWPAKPIAIDAKRSTAWLHGKLTFDNEALERVAAEFNRYTAKPIEIETPALRKLRITGVFATDDTEAFIAFLRSLKGVRVEVTASRIVVSEH